MKHELKIKRQIYKEGEAFLIPEPCDDNFLMQLRSYLFEHRGDIPYILKILNDPNVRGYGGNLMYTRMEGLSVFIYDHTDDDPEWFQIEINRADLIKIFEAWLELNEQIVPRGGIKEIILQRDEEHINMIAYYEDGSEFRRTFNYKVK